MIFNNRLNGTPTYIRTDTKKTYTEDDVRPKMMKVTPSGEKFRYFIEPEDLKQIVESQKSGMPLQIDREGILEKPMKFEENLKQSKQRENAEQLADKNDIQNQTQEHSNDLSFEINKRSIELLNLDINIPHDSSDGLDDVYAEAKLPVSKKIKPKADSKSIDSTRRKRYTKKIKRSNSCPQSMRSQFGQTDIPSVGGGYSLRKSQGHTDISIKRGREMLYEQPSWRRNITNILFLVILSYLFLAGYSYIDELNRYHEKFNK